MIDTKFGNKGEEDEVEEEDVMMTILEGDEAAVHSFDNRISSEEAIRCSLSIPHEFVQTVGDEEFLKNIANVYDQEEDQFDKDIKDKKKVNMKASSSLTNPIEPSTTVTQENGDGVISESGVKEIVVKQSGIVQNNKESRSIPKTKLCSVFAKYKKWDEAERCKVELLENNKVRIDDNLIMEIDHSNYIKEEDVILDLDEDYRTCSMPALPTRPLDSFCEASTCRLGCICASVKNASVVRKHCGIPGCFFKCTCHKDRVMRDGIISRLRPRASLLNWRYAGEEMDKDKDKEQRSRPINYRQLEQGFGIYPRPRRVAVAAPQRFRKNQKFVVPKTVQNLRELRSRSIAANKLNQNESTIGGVRRDPGFYRRRPNYRVKSLPKETETTDDKSIPAKNNNKLRPKPRIVVDESLKTIETEPEESKKAEEQTPLLIPKVVQTIQRDAMVFLMGSQSLCFLTFSLEFKHPRAIIYKETNGDQIEIPWLYIPFPSHGESWVFHQIQSDSSYSEFTCIPEINCLIPSKALRMHMNSCNIRKKTVALKIMWIGEDAKHRQGNIYILPNLPNVLVCGPFPRHLMTSRFNPDFNPIRKIENMCDFADNMMSKRSIGDAKSWERFWVQKKEQISSELQARVRNDTSSILRDKPIPANVIMEGMSDCSSDSSSASLVEEKVDASRIFKPNSKLCVSWNDAAKLLSVFP